MEARKHCRTCGALKPLGEFVKSAQAKDGYKATCRACWAAYVRSRPRDNEQRRMAQRRYVEKHRTVCKVHQITNDAVKYGKLVRQPCEVCGAKRAVGHHDDYDKPLEVRWLCARHHTEWHEQHGPGAHLYDGEPRPDVNENQEQDAPAP